MTTNHQILLLSSSRAGDGGYLEAARTPIRKFLGERPLRICFVPFAAVGMSYADYAARVKEALGAPYEFEILTPLNATDLLQACDAIMVGGGNTFKLLAELFSSNTLDPIYQRVMKGKPYVGWSAGANIAGRSICTTNDMPIVQPPSFLGLRFYSFQVNPHYYNYRPEGFHGESRDDRLEEFCTLNPGIPVVAMPEGTSLRLKEDVLWYEGDAEGIVFEGKYNGGGVTRHVLTPGSDVSFLL